MEKSAKFIIIKGIVVMLIVAVAGFFLFNGFGKHPYTYEELEGAFRQKAAEMGVVGQGEEEMISAEYGNSVTYLMRVEDGERACATYARSLFFDKYKEIKFYAGVNGVLAVEEITYPVSDGAMSYDLTMRFGEELEIVPGTQVMPIMYVKLIGVCFIMMVIFGSKLFFGRRR